MRPNPASLPAATRLKMLAADCLDRCDHMRVRAGNLLLDRLRHHPDLRDAAADLYAWNLIDRLLAEGAQPRPAMATIAEHLRAKGQEPPPAQNGRREGQSDLDALRHNAHPATTQHDGMGGQSNGAAHRPLADHAVVPNAAGAGHIVIATPNADARPAPQPKEPTPVQRAAVMAARASIARSVLDSHQTELGKPLGDCTREDLENLTRRSRHRVGFYGAVASRLPTLQAVTREHLSGDEANRLYQTAWEAVDAAE